MNTPHQTKPKVYVQVVQHLSPGGIETMALEMAEEIERDSTDQCYVISLEGGYQTAVARWPRLKKHQERLIFLNKKSGWRLGTVWQLTQLFKQLKVDAVHSHHIGPLIYAGLAARMAGISGRIHTEHDAWHLQSRKRLWLEKLLLSMTKPNLVADANLVFAAMQQAGLMYPAQVICNGIDSRKFIAGDQQQALAAFGLTGWWQSAADSNHFHNDNADKNPAFKPVVLGCAGRLVKEKGYHILLQAMQQLPEHYLLLIAGDGPLKITLQQQAQQLGIEHRVQWLGAVNNMLPFYQALNIYTMASLKEGLPLSPLEAQSCGVPVVLTDVGGCSEAICPTTGYLSKPQCSKTLATNLQNIMQVQQQPANKNHSPRDFITQCRDLTVMVKAYQNLI